LTALDSVHTYRPKVLGDYIQAFRIYRFVPNQTIRLVPKGVFEVVIQSDDGFLHNTAYSGGWTARPRYFVGGLHTRSNTVRPQGSHSYCIVAEFKPHTSRYFVPEMCNHFKDALISITDIWGASATKLTNDLQAHSSEMDKIDQLEHFFLNHLIRQGASTIDPTLRMISPAKGGVPVATLAKAVKLSAAQFRKRFKEEIGLSPSQYCKIVRVNHVIRALQADRSQSLTQLTYAMGYYDQSHFIREFKSIMCQTPNAYWREVWT